LIPFSPSRDGSTAGVGALGSFPPHPTSTHKTHNMLINTNAFFITNIIKNKINPQNPRAEFHLSSFLLQTPSLFHDTNNHFYQMSISLSFYP
jgi:hypothetical protein